MNIKKFIIGTLTGAIVFFLLGWLIYGHLLERFMYHHTGKAGHIVLRRHIVLGYIAAGNLLQGLLLAYILVKGNINTVIAGALTGGIIGFLMTASIDIIMYATTFVLSKKGMLADVLAFTVISSIAGALTAAVAGRKTTPFNT